LLLHGIGAIWRAWSPVLPYLEPHHDVIVPTLPGHAGGPPLDVQGAPSVAALADSIEAELDRLGMHKVVIRILSDLTVDKPERYGDNGVRPYSVPKPPTVTSVELQ
jgi:Alpha/beta hydrolase family